MTNPGWFINPANLYALPYLRTMCGSRAGLDVEYQMMKGMLGRIQPDGLMNFPNNAGWPAGTSVPNVNGQLAMALINWYARDKNPGWLDYVGLLCKGLDRTAIRVQDRAYYPLECGIDASGAWHWTNRGASVIPYTPAPRARERTAGLRGVRQVDDRFRPDRALRGQYRYKARC